MNQKCLSFCSKILLKVLHNTSLNVLLPWQHTGFQTLQNKKNFWPPSAFHFHICKWCLVCMIPQAYKYVFSFSVFELKIRNILTSSGWEWKRVSCHGNKILIAVDVFPVELLAKFQWSALQIGQDSSIYILEIVIYSQWALA